jgi:hypothetical protein
LVVHFDALVYATIQCIHYLYTINTLLMIFIRLLCATVKFALTLGPDSLSNIFHINFHGLLSETYLFFTPFRKYEMRQQYNF